MLDTTGQENAIRHELLEPYDKDTGTDKGLRSLHSCQNFTATADWFESLPEKYDAYAATADELWRSVD